MIKRKFYNKIISKISNLPQVRMSPKIKILFVASNPQNTTRLGLDEEMRGISQKVRLSEYRDLLEIVSIWAARPDDLIQALNEHQPNIVHFSGHGSNAGEIVLSDDSGHSKAVSAGALQRLFRAFNKSIQVVVLNACYSDIQAQAIANEIDCVIGMQTQIGDEAAILFASSFYRAIGFGCSIQEAFEQGCIAIQINEIPEETTPKIVVKGSLNPGDIYVINTFSLKEEKNGSVMFEGPGGVNALEIPHFHGRDLEMSMLTQALTQSPGPDCLVVAGLGGSGKTSLVNQWVTTLASKHFPDGTLWIDFSHFSEELTRAARRFGWAGNDDPSVRQAIQWFGQEVHDLRFLIIVDNVPTNHNQIDLRLLPIFGKKSKTIITTRSISLADDLGRTSSLIQVREWELDTCRSYFRESVPGLAETQDEILDQLSSFVGGLPLAIRLLSKLLQRKGITPDALGRKLNDSLLKTLESQASNMDRSIVTAFEESISQLSARQHQAILAVAACAQFTTTSAVASLINISDDNVQDELSTLADYSLLDYSAESTRPWSMHDLTRAFLREQVGYQSLEKAHILYIQKIIPVNLASEHELLLEKLMPEIREVISQYSSKEEGEQAWKLIQQIQPYLIRHAQFETIARLCEQNLTLLPENAQAMGILGLCNRKLGKVNEAIEWHHRSLSIHIKLRDMESEALELSRLGACYYARDDETKAINLFSQSLEKYETIGNQLGISEQLGYLGLCYLVLGDFEQATQNIRRALVIDQKQKFLEKKSEHHGYLGDMLRAQNDVNKAIKEYNKALLLDEQLGYVDLQARHFAGLGLSYRLLGNVPTAIDYLNKGIAMCRQSGNLATLEFQLGQLGTCYRMEKNLPKSIECFEETLNISFKLGNLRSQSVALRRLGKAYRAFKDMAKAEDLLDQSLKIEVSLGNHYAQYAILEYFKKFFSLSKSREKQYKTLQKKITKNKADNKDTRSDDEFDIIEPHDVANNADLREYYIQRLSKNDTYKEIAFIQMTRETYLDLLRGDNALLSEMIQNNEEASDEMFLSYAGDKANSVIMTFNIETANVGEMAIAYIEKHKRTEAHQLWLDEMKVLAKKMQQVHRKWMKQKCRYFDVSYTRRFKPLI